MSFSNKIKVGDSVVFTGSRKNARYMKNGDVGVVKRLTTYGVYVKFDATDKWNGLAVIRYSELRKYTEVDSFFEEMFGNE